MQLPALLRKADWFTSKVPIALSYYSLGWLVRGQQGLSAYAGGLLVLLGIFVATGVFVRFYNDIFDRQADALSGKFNLAQQLPRRWWLPVLLLSSGSIVLLLLWADAPWYSWWLLALQHLLYILYSTPPVRLKERAWAGILADAGYGHAVPAMIALTFALGRDGQDPGAYGLLILLAGGLQLVAGINNIFYHQLTDYDNDRRAGSRTMAVRRGPRLLQVTGARITLPLETLLLVGLLVYAARLLAQPALLMLVVLALLFVGKAYRDEQPSLLLLRPLAIHDTWLPLSWLLLLALGDGRYWLLLPAQLAVFYYPTGDRLYYYLRLLADLARRLWYGLEWIYYHRLLRLYTRWLQWTGKLDKSPTDDRCAE